METLDELQRLTSRWDILEVLLYVDLVAASSISTNRC